MSDFRKLEVWQKAHKLTLDVYESTSRFPKAELFGLVSQLRRATSSIGCNIAEGLGRRSDKEFLRFLRISHGSATEVEYQLLLSRDLGYLSDAHYQRLNRQADEVSRMLTGLELHVTRRARVSTSRVSCLEPHA